MEWNASNTLTLAIAGIGWIGSFIGLVWYLSGRLTRIESGSTDNGKKLEAVDRKIDNLDAAFNDHVLDHGQHITLEQRKDMSKRIDKIEMAVERTGASLGDKIDRVMDHLLRHK